MYNLPEKNVHLSNQRLDGGKVNVRSFKIAKRDSSNGLEDLMRKQFEGSVVRVTKPNVAVQNVQDGVLENSFKFTQASKGLQM